MTRAIEAATAPAPGDAEVRRRRLIAFALRALIVALLATVAFQVVTIWIPNMQNGEAPPGMDYGFYVERTQSWLSGDGFYRDRQLHGPYEEGVLDADAVARRIGWC